MTLNHPVKGVLILNGIESSLQDLQYVRGSYRLILNGSERFSGVTKPCTTSTVVNPQWK